MHMLRAEAAMCAGPVAIDRLPVAAAAAIRGVVVIPSLARTVEELVLNSLDARATRIDVRARAPTRDVGGCVDVADDGCGITAADFQVLGETGATSKALVNPCGDVVAAEPTATVVAQVSYGHRGEALHALRYVASTLEVFSTTDTVSTATACTSAATNGLTHDKRVAIGGKTWHKEWRNGSVVSCGAITYRRSRGTTVRAKNLLGTLPVRRRAAADAGNQGSAARRCIERLSLMHPHVMFHFEELGTGAGAAASSSSTEALALPLQLWPAKSLAERITQVLGIGCLKSLTELSSFSSGAVRASSRETRFTRGRREGSVRLCHAPLVHATYSVEGVVTLPGEESHPSSRFVFVFVNGRFVENTPIHGLVGRLYSRCADLLAGRPITGGMKGPLSIAAAAAGDSWPTLVLNVRCRPDSYDIGCCPDRTVVEFRDWREPLACVANALQNVLTRHSPLFANVFRGFGGVSGFGLGSSLEGNSGMPPPVAFHPEHRTVDATSEDRGGCVAAATQKQQQPKPLRKQRHKASHEKAFGAHNPDVDESKAVECTEVLSHTSMSPRKRGRPGGGEDALRNQGSLSSSVLLQRRMEGEAAEIGKETQIDVNTARQGIGASLLQRRAQHAAVRLAAATNPWQSFPVASAAGSPPLSPDTQRRPPAVTLRRPPAHKSTVPRLFGSRLIA
eukprot:TRINITY_DN75862_c0_g1_i1.p1 TRINITY_DN75862_c0_g1~~TRINITY_DN75862_c0_g1_i1.p1  ORF type:complete len:678 (-),score=88.34 TRINITY_DN75862_c0_g1_i1:54-2087(-)